MKVSASIDIAALLLILLGGNGCASSTKAVSSAPPPQKVTSAQSLTPLQLFFSPQRRDLLVVYEELPNDGPAMHTRAYWLYESTERLAHDGHVSFVKTNAAPDLVSVPVFNTTAALATNPPDSLSAITLDGCNFTVYSGQREVSSHTLPIPHVRTGRSAFDKFADDLLAAELEAFSDSWIHTGKH